MLTSSHNNSKRLDVTLLAIQEELECDTIISIRIYRQDFENKKAIIISFKEVMSKVWARLNDAKLSENRQKLLQMESYRATLNHEMRAPIETS